MTDIQGRVSQHSHSRTFGASGLLAGARWHSVLGNPRLGLLKQEHIALSDVTFAIFHFPVAGVRSGYRQT